MLKMTSCVLTTSSIPYRLTRCVAKALTRAPHLETTAGMCELFVPSARIRNGPSIASYANHAPHRGLTGTPSAPFTPGLAGL